MKDMSKELCRLLAREIVEQAKLGKPLWEMQHGLPIATETCQETMERHSRLGCRELFHAIAIEIRAQSAIDVSDLINPDSGRNKQ